MSMPIRSAVLLAVFSCTTALLAVAEEPLTREEVAKRAKGSTVLVDARPNYGSGFCVHPSGLFVTNEHVLRQGIGGVGEVTLVLNAGLKSQKTVKAKVVRRDKQLDLALLKAEGQEQFEALTLGSDKELVELTEVIAFGFPFGVALARTGEYPAISVNTGSVTSLRNDKEGELSRIQLDAALNVGNSGGPVLDRKGKVVGMVVSGILGAGGNTGVNLAIPVSHLQRFLSRPEIEFTPPVVKADGAEQAVDFTAKVVSLPVLKDPLELELVLGVRPGTERRFPMKLTDGSYGVKAVPFPKREGPLVLQAAVRFENGYVRGTVEDQTFGVGPTKVKLSEVKGLRLRPKPEVLLGDGKKLEGSLSDLGVLTVKVGKQALQLDLANASEVRVDPPEDTSGVSCTVVARQGGKEVGRASAPLYPEGTAGSTLEALAEGKFIRPLRSGGPVSYLRALSKQGDYIGQGKSYSYGGEEMTAHVTPRGVQLQVGGFGAWMVEFGGPGRRFLEVGEYADAKRLPFSGDSPGMQFSGNGRACNKLAGKFVVWEIEVRGNEVVRLAVDFIQHCEEKMPPLSGKVRINSSFH
jgi:S1-C subfamily serine protease